MERVKLRKIGIIVALVLLILVGAEVHADALPTPDELRGVIDENARAIADGKRVGFGYTLARSWTAYVPSENLPGRITESESPIRVWRETFLRKGDLRALAVHTRSKTRSVYSSHITTWNGKVLKYYDPSEALGHVEFKDDRARPTLMISSCVTVAHLR